MSAETTAPTTLPAWVAPAFFSSGFAALIYQVVWQRVLFATFGINIEAVTIVVTAFLLGLGFGSLAGGVLSGHRRIHPLVAFAGLELAIGVYGLISVPLFHWAAELSLGTSTAAAGAMSFALVVIPTLFMGATLPLLVSFAIRCTGNVGLSVGWLYFVNTAGSALASVATVVFVLRAVGETGSVRIAAAANFAVALFVLSRYHHERSAS
ncbi:MAG: Spermidine synthase [Gemmatimonadetes bacterium]|nr:Spermidine synthase [Gemmatimonadota bacterium]